MECCTIFPSFSHSVPSSAQHLYIMIKWHSKSHNIIRQISFFSFWLKPADSSFSCWHFLVSLYYAYTMTKVIITNYLNTYHLLVLCKKKDVCVILIQTRKDILLCIGCPELQIGLYFHLISLLLKWHCFFAKIFFSYMKLMHIFLFCKIPFFISKSIYDYHMYFL